MSLSCDLCELLDGIFAVDMPIGFMFRARCGHDYMSDGHYWHLKSKLLLRTTVLSLDVCEVEEYLIMDVAPIEMLNSDMLNEDVNVNCNWYDDVDDQNAHDMSKNRNGRGRPRKDRRCIRIPTEYNKFVKMNMSDIRERNPGLDNRSYMRLCANLWNEFKETKGQKKI